MALHIFSKTLRRFKWYYTYNGRILQIRTKLSYDDGNSKFLTKFYIIAPLNLESTIHKINSPSSKVPEKKHTHHMYYGRYRGPRKGLLGKIL